MYCSHRLDSGDVQTGRFQAIYDRHEAWIADQGRLKETNQHGSLHRVAFNKCNGFLLLVKLPEAIVKPTLHFNQFVFHSDTDFLSQEIPIESPIVFLDSMVIVKFSASRNQSRPKRKLSPNHLPSERSFDARFRPNTFLME
jgi:hypothetical protein